jgi:radical SAM superfamily enzyme YgiQ (UPF0313 family)
MGTRRPRQDPPEGASALPRGAGFPKKVYGSPRGKVVQIAPGSRDPGICEAKKATVTIAIIAPSRERTIWKAGGKRRAGFPPLALPVLAAVTPPAVEVQLIDENVELVDTSAPCDLAAISCSTATALHGYEIADAFRSKGVPVIMGGAHPTALPEEALEHADSVVIGEAETVWGQVIADAEAHRLQRVYRADRLADMTTYPIPRRDLLKPKGYLLRGTLETGRGCPQNCTFCSVSRTFGRGRRLRPIRDVVAEVEQLDTDTIIFMDDNILAPPQRAKELFRELAPLKRKWGGQAWLPPLADVEMLTLLRKSGCVALFVGLESISEAALRGANKHSNSVGRYKELIRKSQDHGVGILGAFVFGFDEDDKTVFERTTDFAVKARLDVAQFAILTPYPGTALFEDLHAQERIFDYNWSNYTMSQAVYHPKQITADELKEGHDWAERAFFSTVSIARRCLRPGPHFLFRVLVNWSYRRAHVGKSILAYGTPGRGRSPIPLNVPDLLRKPASPKIAPP